jgi:hypothetical protein
LPVIPPPAVIDGGAYGRGDEGVGVLNEVVVKRVNKETSEF